MGSKFGQAIYWVLTEPLCFLPQCILPVGHIAGWKFCGWDYVHVPLLGILPCCRRRPVWAPYGMLWREFTRVTILDYMEFPCIRFQNITPEMPPFPVVSTNNPSVHPTPPPDTPVHTPSYPQNTVKIYSISLPSDILALLFENSLLLVTWTLCVCRF